MRIILGILILFLAHCNDEAGIKQRESNTVVANHFSDELESENLGSPSPYEWNIPHRKVLLEGGRPIANVFSLSVSWANESIKYEDNVLLIRLDLIIDKNVFNNNEYIIVMKNGEPNKAVKEFKTVKKVKANFGNTSLFNCELSFKVNLKDLENTVDLYIDQTGSQDRLISKVEISNLYKKHLEIYEDFIAKGKKAPGVFSDLILF